MFCIMQILAVISIVAILKSASINSLPQNLFESEGGFLVSAKPDQDMSPISTEFNSDVFDTNDERLDFDSVLVMNTDPLNSNENEPIIAANTEDTVAGCQNGNRQKIGGLNGRDFLCPSRQELGLDMDMSIQWLRSSFEIPITEGTLPQKMCDIANNLIFKILINNRDLEEKASICPAPWKFHLCGDGPASQWGRIDILGWPVHRRAIANLLRTSSIAKTF